MSQIIKTALWGKFIITVSIFLLSLYINFFIFKEVDPETFFYLILFVKPVLYLVFLFLLNFLFIFPQKIKVPNLIASVFFILSFCIFIDLGYLIYSFYPLLIKYLLFWGIYGGLLLLSVLNFIKFVKSFTVGVDCK